MYKITLENVSPATKQKINRILNEDKRVKANFELDDVVHRVCFKLRDLEVGEFVRFEDGTIFKTPRYPQEWEINSRPDLNLTKGEKYDFITVLKNLTFLAKEKVNWEGKKDPTPFNRINTANRFLGLNAEVLKIDKDYITLSMDSIAGGTKIYPSHDYYGRSSPDGTPKYTMSKTYATKKKIRINMLENSHL